METKIIIGLAMAAAALFGAPVASADHANGIDAQGTIRSSLEADRVQYSDEAWPWNTNGVPPTEYRSKANTWH